MNFIKIMRKRLVEDDKNASSSGNNAQNNSIVRKEILGINSSEIEYIGDIDEFDIYGGVLFQSNGE